jgi:hypothetical protein
MSAVPKSVGELAEEERAAQRALDETSLAIADTLEELRVRYSTLMNQHDAQRERLAAVQGRLSAERVMLDQVLLPRTLAPWVDDVKSALLPAPHGARRAELCEASRPTATPALGLQPMDQHEVRAGVAAAAEQGQRPSGEGGGYRPADQPAAEFLQRAFIPYAAAFEDGAQLRLRPALADVAVVRCADVGGRALIAKRSYAPGDLLFAEAPFAVLPTRLDDAAAWGINPLLRRALTESIFGPEGAAVMARQKWDGRLVVSLFVLLSQWTELATSADAAEPTVRKALLQLACPLRDMDVAQLTALDKFSRFVHAALPPCYRVFDADRDRTNAEHSAIRRGIGEAAAVSAHHQKSIREATPREAQQAFAPVLAPYDDNPLHRYVAVSPISGAVTTAHAEANGADETSTAAVLPAWCKVTAEDVARIMLIVQCNSLSGGSGGGPATAAAVSPTRSSASQQHLLYLTAALEHSCSPNTAVIQHHLPTVGAALEAYGVDAMSGSTRSECGTGAGLQSVLAHDKPLFELRALCSIAAGERLSISYTSLIAPRPVRLSRLRQQYHFTCHCNACAGHEGRDWSRCATFVGEGDAGAAVVVCPESPSAVWTGVRGMVRFGADAPAVLALLRQETAMSEVHAAGAAAEAADLLAAVRRSTAALRAERTIVGGLVPLACLHFGPLLRFMRVVAMTLSETESACNVAAALLDSAAELLVQWQALLAPEATGPKSWAARLLTAVANLTTAIGNAAAPLHPVRFTSDETTLRLVAFVFLVPLVDHTAAVHARFPRATDRSSVWVAARSICELAIPSPHAAATARAAVLAADPTATSLPPHLE